MDQRTLGFLVWLREMLTFSEDRAIRFRGVDPIRSRYYEGMAWGIRESLARAEGLLLKKNKKSS